MDILVNINGAKWCDEWKIGGNLLEFGLRNGTIPVMIVVFENSLHHCGNMFVDSFRIQCATNTGSPIRKHH